MIKWTSAELSPNLKRLNIKPSYFIQNAKDILTDEEYLKNNFFIKCPFCDNKNIKSYLLDKNNVDNFISKLSYSTKEQINWVNNIEETFNIYERELKKLGFGKKIPILYCKDCKKLLKIWKNLTFIDLLFNEDDILEILEEEGTLDKHGHPISCPCCSNRIFKHSNSYFDGQGEVEYDLQCKKCNNIIYHFSYGAKMFPYNYSYESKFS